MGSIEAPSVKRADLSVASGEVASAAKFSAQCRAKMLKPALKTLRVGEVASRASLWSRFKLSAKMTLSDAGLDHCAGSELILRACFKTCCAGHSCVAR